MEAEVSRSSGKLTLRCLNKYNSIPEGLQVSLQGPEACVDDSDFHTFAGANHGLDGCDRVRIGIHRNHNHADLRVVRNVFSTMHRKHLVWRSETPILVMA